MEHGSSASEMASRRTMLAAAAVGVTGSVAGCMGGFEEDEDDDGDGDDESERTGDGTADTAGQDDTGENDGEDDTTGQQTDTFNPGWNPHDILSNNPDEWHYPSRLTAVDVRQNIHPDFQLRGIPHGLDYLFELSSEEVNASMTTLLPEMTEIGILQEDYTEDDFLETVNSPQSKITDANIEHQENVTYAKGEEAEAAYTTDQNGRPVIITSDQIGEELQNSIDYMNSNREPIRPQHVEDDLLPCFAA